jgi:large subunit ribosomal protein L18
MNPNSKIQKRQRLHKKIMSRMKGTKDCPRLCVFRSASHIYAQLIDDEGKKILASSSDIKLPGKKANKINSAKEVGKMIAEKGKKIKIEKVVFDRGGFLYHGRIKALAEGAREAGLKF